MSELVCFGFDSMNSDHDIEQVRRLIARVNRAEDELASLRAMLPKKVEGLPTEPGWYWCRGKYKMQVKEVALVNSEFCLWDGSKWANVESFKGLTWYGPLTPPEVK